MSSGHRPRPTLAPAASTGGGRGRGPDIPDPVLHTGTVVLAKWAVNRSAKPTGCCKKPQHRPIVAMRNTGFSQSGFGRNVSDKLALAFPCAPSPASLRACATGSSEPSTRRRPHKRRPGQRSPPARTCCSPRHDACPGAACAPGARACSPREGAGRIASASCIWVRPARRRCSRRFAANCGWRVPCRRLSRIADRTSTDSCHG